MVSSSSHKFVHSWDLPHEGATTIACHKCAGRFSRSSMSTARRREVLDIVLRTQGRAMYEALRRVFAAPYK